MQEYTLISVDMQSYFPPANDPATIANVEREVRQARKRGFPVLLVWIPYFSALDEEGLPRTHESIREIVKDYKRATDCTKGMFGGDGSRNVLNACNHEGFTTKRFRVVGVHTAGCVHALVQGLIEPDPGYNFFSRFYKEFGIEGWNHRQLDDILKDVLCGRFDGKLGKKHGEVGLVSVLAEHYPQLADQAVYPRVVAWLKEERKKYRRNLPQIEVVKDACNSGWGRECDSPWEDSDWSMFEEMRNVTLI